MGSWGPGPFENDGAGNWFNELEDRDPSERTAFVAETFDGAAEDTSYLQVDEGESIVAAAALIALHLPEGPSMTLVPRPEYFHADELWVEVNDELRHDAVRALDRVTADNSELGDLWEGDETFLSILAQIRRVLAGTTS